MVTLTNNQQGKNVMYTAIVAQAATGDTKAAFDTWMGKEPIKSIAALMIGIGIVLIIFAVVKGGWNAIIKQQGLGGFGKSVVTALVVGVILISPKTIIPTGLSITEKFLNGTSNTIESETK